MFTIANILNKFKIKIQIHYNMNKIPANADIKDTKDRNDKTAP